MNNPVGIFLAGAQLFFAFFPFTRILPLPTDSQPNALILSVVVCAVSVRRKLPARLWYIAAVLIFAMAAMLWTSPDAMGLRSLLNYLSLFFITAATYISLSVLNGLPYGLFKAVVSIWFSVGLIQYTVYPSFLEFLMFRSSNSLMLDSGRGVTSLAVEPTYYGTICILLMLVNYLNFRSERHYWLLSAVLLAQLVVFSMSTTCILVLGGCLSVYAVFQFLTGRKRLWFLAGTVIVALTAGFFLPEYISTSESRLATTLRVLAADPTLVLTMDYSIQNRFMHAFFPIKGFFDNWGMPHGFSGYYDYLKETSLLEPYQRILSLDISSERRVGTAFGGPLFELGIFAMPLYIALFRSLRQICTRYRYGFLCALIFVALIMNNSTWNIAIFDLVLGNLIYLAYHGNRTSNLRNRSRL